VKSRTDKSGFIDIYLNSDFIGEGCLAVIEVGFVNSAWWKKFAQGTKYVDYLLESVKDHLAGKGQEHKQPLLLAILTIEPESCKSKLGVFLCVPSPSMGQAQFRIIALSYTISLNLEDASKSFGQFLRTVSWFSNWRRLEPNANDGYEYLSPNCCRVGGTHVRNEMLLACLLAYLSVLI